MSHPTYGFLGLIILLVSCSNERSTTPEPEPIDEYTFETTVTVGPAGGTIAISEFSLIVPENAIAEDATIELYSSSTDQPFGDYTVSTAFRIEGLPDSTYLPLKVRITYNDTLSHESFLALGMVIPVLGSDSTRTVFTWFETTDSSGHLLAEIPPTVAEPGSFRTVKRQQCADFPSWGVGTLCLVSGYFKYEDPPEDLHAIYPYDMVHQLEYTLNCLDAVRDTFAAMGFDYSFVRQPSQEIGEISLLARPDANLYYEEGPLSALVYRVSEDCGYNIQIEHDPYVLSPVVLCPAAASEFFKIVQIVNAPNVEYDIENPDPVIDALLTGSFWFNEATCLWAEEKLGYYPSKFRGNEITPFDGMGTYRDPSNPRKDRANHGHGMSAVIKYFVDRFDEDRNGDKSVLAKTYDEMRNATHPIEAMISSASDPVNEWWPDFFQEYVCGNVYDASLDSLTKNKSGTFDVRPDGDTSKQFSADYADLSARLYTITLNDDSLGSGAWISLQASSSEVAPSDLKVLVFRTKDGSIEFVKGGTSVTVGDLQNLTSQDYDLAAVVVNSHNLSPYTGKSNITLEINVNRGSDLDEIEYALIQVGNIRVYYAYDDDTCGTPSMTSANSTWFFLDKQGDFDSASFSASWHESTSGIWGNLDKDGTMLITLDYSQQTASFTITENVTDRDTDCTGELIITGSDIPFVQPDYHDLKYMAVGSGVCSDISIQWRQICPNWDCDIIIDDKECSATSGVRIEMW